MKREVIEKLIQLADVERKKKFEEIDNLFEVVLSNLNWSEGKPLVDTKMCETMVKNAKWHYDTNRYVNISPIFKQVLNPEARIAYLKLVDIFEKIPHGTSIKTYYGFIKDLMDSEKKYFKGDIIITDPCYIMDKTEKLVREPIKSDYIKGNIDTYDDVVIIPLNELKEHLPESVCESLPNGMCKYSYKYDTANRRYSNDLKYYEKAKKDNELEYITDWDLTKYGQTVECLGITQYMSRDTIFGDWSCTLVNSDTKEPLGDFSADAGMVCVTELGEWRKYNPKVDEWVAKHPWCVTVLSNFEGYVWFEVVDIDAVQTGASQYKLKSRDDYEVQVVGEGTLNGKPIRFNSVFSSLEDEDE